MREVLAHPRVYPFIGDDFAPPVSEFQPNADPRVVYLLVRDGETLLGVLMQFPVTPVFWEGHISMLPAGWGRAADAIAGGLRWMWQHTTAATIAGTVASCNRLACRAAVRGGMQETGRIPASFCRDGRLVDQIIFTSRRRNF